MTSVVGIDLGGTKVAAAQLRDRHLSEAIVHPTELSSSDALLDQLVGAVEEAREDELDAVGIGVPSVVDFATGQGDLVGQHPAAPICRCARCWVGGSAFPCSSTTTRPSPRSQRLTTRICGCTTQNLVMLTLGTGLGGGLVLGGRIYRGTTGAAGEVGHTLVAVDVSDGLPAPTQFPQPGSIESLASGRALDHLASTIGLRSGVAVVEAALDGRRRRRGAVVERWARMVGIAVANAINLFDPDEVVLGGGAARAGDLLLGPARDAAAGYVLPGVGRRTTVRLARHGIRSGVLGAALLAAHELGGAGVSMGGL